nr:hypothetical protein [Tanacetum cinerariifolium]
MHDTSSSSGNYITHVVDANIRPVNNQVPFTEVQLTAQHNVLANEQQHTDQSKPIYNTYLLEKVNSNTSLFSTNMSHMGGEIDQDAKHDQVKSPVLKAEFLEMKYMVEKEVYNELSNRFLQLENIVFHLKFQYNKRKKVFKLTNHKCGFNANHYDCITKFLKKVNSHAKVQSPKTRNINKPVEPKSHNQKPDRQIVIGQRFSLNKFSDVREKPNSLRSCLRWIPTGRIFKTAGLRWIPTGNMFTDNTTKVDSEPPYGSNEDITNPYECKQSLDVSVSTLNLSAVQASDLNVNKMASADNTSGLALQRKERCTLQCALSLEEEKSSCLRPFSSTSFMLFYARLVIKNGHTTPGYISSGLMQNSVSPTPYVPPSKKDYEILFQQLFDKYFNPLPRVVSLVPAAVAALRAVDPAGSPSSTTIDQDVPSISSSPTTQEIQSQVTHQGVEEQIHGHQNT